MVAGPSCVWFVVLEGDFPWGTVRNPAAGQTQSHHAVVHF